ncbi:sarcoplasmic calcium-binding proteins I, III, and IV-like isoform X2 [Lineus longissimus]|uniref:sarcoplasmic calcium-binding proteins I, III, and IV-like isoform X2 n=1 Tax=Lineus longissimus TaxID=88925 RepID=UPI002B4D1FFA
MGLSEFQKKKLGHVFDVFYDVNRDGRIDWNDFEDLIVRVSDINGWGKTGEKYNNGRKVLENVWGGLQKYADKNADKAVSKDEWLEMWTGEVEKVKANKSLPEWQVNYLNFFFDASDTSGDDIVDLDEYSKVYTKFGLTEDKCKTAFNKITDSGKCELNKELYRALWTEYLITDDQTNRANFLFGPI